MTSNAKIFPIYNYKKHFLQQTYIQLMPEDKYEQN